MYNTLVNKLPKLFLLIIEKSIKEKTNQEDGDLWKPFLNIKLSKSLFALIKQLAF